MNNTTLDELKHLVKAKRCQLQKEARKLRNKAYYDMKKDDIKVKNAQAVMFRYHHDEAYRLKQKENNKRWYAHHKMLKLEP